MIFLLFLLDVCFYNYTSISSFFILNSFLEPKEKKSYFFIFLLLIELLLHTHFRFFLLLSLLFFFNSFCKLPKDKTYFQLIRFLLNYLLLQIGFLLLFHTFVFDALGLLIPFLFLRICHKK